MLNVNNVINVYSVERLLAISTLYMTNYTVLWLKQLKQPQKVSKLLTKVR